MRTRWAAVGAAVAVTLGAGGLVAVDAATPPSSFVGIEPARVLDTRIDAGLAGPFTSATPRTLDVTGTIEVVFPGDQVGMGAPVPDGATSIVANVTVTEPVTGGFVSLRPGDATGTPTTSTVNFGAGETVANAATVELPASGLVQLFYQGQTPSSTAEIIVDIVGYHLEGAAGPKGDPGDPGPQGDPGAQGDPGPRGLSAWDTIPSGQTVVGEFAYDTQVAEGGDAFDQVFVPFPGIAPAPLGSADVNFSSAPFGDADATCSGTVAAPTAPAGKVCIYALGSSNVNESLTTGIGTILYTSGFRFSIREDAGATDGDDKFLDATWAYTAP